VTRRRAVLFVLPNLFTVSSIFCGLYAIIQATEGAAPDRFYMAAVAIIFAVIFDSADGRVARMTKTQSDIGIQLDSLADAISFGVAPAILVYKWALFHFGIWGMLVAFVYATCGVIRLARFNVLAAAATGPSKHFLGLPIPLAAASLVSLVLVHYRSGGVQLGYQPLMIVVMLLLSALMVSNVHYRTFKAVKAKQTALVVLGLAGLVLIALVKTGFSLMFMMVVSGMIALGPAEELVRFVRRRLPGSEAEPPEEEEEESLS
jgi:CDP-diacylglycerol---serine O-phosphatidyltransferase